MAILSLLKDKAPLYLVGGAVRDELLSYPVSDVDLCGPLAPEELEKKLCGLFAFKDVNPRIGTVKISMGNEFCEYTRFRRDSYPISSGRHTPSEVTFVETLEEDAFRRDFTVNALYKRLSDGALFDPTGGMDDLKNKVIRTTREPEKVFSEDGLRLLRLVRFAASLGFEIEEKTFAAAKKFAPLLADISPERIREEFMKILVADERYGVRGAVYRALELMRELGLYEYFLPELTEGIGVTQNSKYHKYDVYYHTLHTVAAAPPRLRLAALLHDIGKPLCACRDGNMYLHAVESAAITENVMKRLRFSKKEIAFVKEIVRWHMFDFNGEAGENKKRLYVLREWNYLEDLVAIKNADSVGTGCFTENVFANRLIEIKNQMKEEGVFLSVKQLPVRGGDLARIGVEENLRAAVLGELLERQAILGAKRDKESLMKQIPEILKELKRR
ncbi:MAG: CCA tRNA nucleotidyltransferase [Clostridia bacterium]|nr:CCA tRNA nucleotidyltransferase [Clostridia bacterium]